MFESNDVMKIVPELRKKKTVLLHSICYPGDRPGIISVSMIIFTLYKQVDYPTMLFQCIALTKAAKFLMSILVK